MFGSLVGLGAKGLGQGQQGRATAQCISTSTPCGAARPTTVLPHVTVMASPALTRSQTRAMLLERSRASACNKGWSGATTYQRLPTCLHGLPLQSQDKSKNIVQPVGAGLPVTSALPFDKLLH
jgi:hypothetical protein